METFLPIQEIEGGQLLEDNGKIHTDIFQTEKVSANLIHNDVFINNLDCIKLQSVAYNSPV